MAFPSEITLIPGYVFYTRLGWVNTYMPLIIPDIAIPFGIFVLAQFFIDHKVYGHTPDLLAAFPGADGAPIRNEHFSDQINLGGGRYFNAGANAGCSITLTFFTGNSGSSIWSTMRKGMPTCLQISTAASLK